MPADNRTFVRIERQAQISATTLDDILCTHLVAPDALRAPTNSIPTSRSGTTPSSASSRAVGKAVQRDVETGNPEATIEHIDATDTAVVPDEESDSSAADI